MKFLAALTNDRERAFRRLFSVLAVCLILKVTGAVVGNYAGYLPPDFRVDFLRGRESYFFGAYQWAFYTHLASGPLSLLLGSALVSEAVRRRFPAGHRVLGRLQVLNVAVFVAPSGLVMAFHAAAGPIAGISLGILAVLTGAAALVGGRMAMQRRFADHRRWMWRCYLLLCSAVVLRLIVGLATVVGVTSVWVDSLATWLSWLVPLATFEAYDRQKRSARRPQVQSTLSGSA